MKSTTYFCKNLINCGSRYDLIKMVNKTIDNNTDGFTTFARRGNKNADRKKSLYIGNLPVKTSVEALKQFCAQHQVVFDSEIVIKDTFAIVGCYSGNIDSAIEALNGQTFNGKPLKVERERKKKPDNKKNVKKNGPHKSTFGQNWSNLPSKSSINTSQSSYTIVNKSTTNDNVAAFDSKDFTDRNEKIANLVVNEINVAQQNGKDVLTSAVVATAFVSMMAYVEEEMQHKSQFDMNKSMQNDDDDEMIHHESTTNGIDVADEPVINTDGYDENENNDDDVDFYSRNKQPLAALLIDEYGEYDESWKEKQQQQQQQQENNSEIADNNNNIDNLTNDKQSSSYSALAPHNKAPIHVEFYTFGYIHGAPAAIRNNGWTYAMPMSPCDCRSLRKVAPYLAWQDGLSGAVKKNLSSSDFRETSKALAIKVFDCIKESIQVGQHGYAKPLRMLVHVGSDEGRHRSVVVAEQAAVALRKLLRSNFNNVITQPCSVGTLHRDINKRNAAAITKQRKRDQLDDDL